MKNSIIYLLVISFLLQSCYSYKTISLKESQLITGKIYKIEQGDKFVKAKLKTVNDSVITVEEGNVEYSLYVKNIKEIKEREFSPLKTVGLSVGLTLSFLALIVVAIEASGGLY